MGFELSAHCGTDHYNNFYINKVIDQDGDTVTIETNYRCRHYKKLYRYVEVYCLQDCDSVPIYENELPY